MAAYTYKPHTRKQLRDIADWLLSTYPTLRIGFAIDIEAIVEAIGITILYRPLSSMRVAGYVTANPRFMMINELQLRSPHRVRNTIAHELAHLILEHHLFTGKPVPEEAHCDKLDGATYRKIEKDAKLLAAEILQPEKLFKFRFQQHYAEKIKSGLDELTSTKVAIIETAGELQVSNMSASIRAKDIGIITEAARKKMFPLIF